jgi:hypothetical protein
MDRIENTSSDVLLEGLFIAGFPMDRNIQLRLVIRHHRPATSYQRYQHLPYCYMTLPALYSISSHVHARTQTKRFHSTVARRMR